MTNRTTFPAWIGRPTDADLVRAVLLDRADGDARAAERAGLTRTAQASIRHLRHLAEQLAPYGTPEPFASTPELAAVPDRDAAAS